MVDWALLGLAGWASLIIYRLLTEGIPDSTCMGYVRGLILAVILGPVCFLFLGYLIFRRIKDGKTSSGKSNG